MAIEKRSLDQWRAAFRKYGGSARHLLANTERKVEDLIDAALCNYEDIRSLFPFGCHGAGDFENDTCYALTMINPRLDKNHRIDRACFQGGIISQYLAQKVFEFNEGALIDDRMTTDYRWLVSDKERRSATVHLFEGAGHRYMFKALSLPVRVRSLSSPNSQIALDLSHVERINVFEPQALGSYDRLDASDYYQPRPEIAAGIDSFVLEVDANGTPSAVIMFQFTVSTTQPSRVGVMSKLWVEHARARPMVKWKLVFVVPQEIERDFALQRWTSVGAQTVWDSRVEQYVLGVGADALWEAAR